MKNLILITIVFLALFFQNCKKDEQDDYSYCTGCPVDAWVGEYTGTGDYFTAATGETFEDVEVEVTITNPVGNNLKIDIVAPNHISFQFFGAKNDDEHYFRLAGSTRSLDMNLYKNSNGTDYKINGTAKTFQSARDSIEVIQSLTFRVFKQLGK